MIQDAGVPLIVLAKRPDFVEAVNSTLRKGGHPVHCTWISDLGDLPDALAQLNPELVLAFTQEIGATPPPTAPQVVATSPDRGEEWPLQKPLTIDFDRAVDPESVHLIFTPIKD